MSSHSCFSCCSSNWWHFSPSDQMFALSFLPPREHLPVWDSVLGTGCKVSASETSLGWGSWLYKLASKLRPFETTKGSNNNYTHIKCKPRQALQWTPGLCRIDRRSVWDTVEGFHSGSAGKNLQCRWHRFDPWVRKVPWRRKRQPTPVFLPGKSHEQRSLMVCGPWGGHKKSWTGLSG